MIGREEATTGAAAAADAETGHILRGAGVAVLVVIAVVLLFEVAWSDSGSGMLGGAYWGARREGCPGFVRGGARGGDREACLPKTTPWLPP